MELDALERKAVELLRSRLEKGFITALNAKVEPRAKDLVSVNGTFEDEDGRLSKFEEVSRQSGRGSSRELVCVRLTVELSLP
jgi:hypothetical protein